MIGPDDMNQDTMTRLALLDPAPAIAPGPAEHARRAELLRRILADPRPSRAITRGTRRARGPVRRLTLAGATILAAAVTAVALVAGLALYRADRAGTGGLTGAELASWTGAPHRLDVPRPRAEPRSTGASASSPRPRRRTARRRSPTPTSAGRSPRS